MNNDNSNNRILLAVALSMLFLIPYMYFFSPKNNKLDENNNTSSNVTNANNAPSINKMQDNNITPIKNNNVNIISTIKSDLFDIKIDDLGRIHSVELKGKKWENKDGTPLNLIDENSIKPLEMRYQNKEINDKAFSTPYKANSKVINLNSNQNQLILTQNLGEVNIKKIITFYDNLKYDLKIEISKPIEYFISSGSRPIADNTAYVFKGIIIKKEDNKIEDINDDDINKEIFNNAKFVAGVDRYYTTLFFNENGLKVIIQAQDKKNIPYIALNENISIAGYIGPKDYRILKNISPILTDVVEYGVITFFAKPLFLLLDYLHSIFKNWGWAIIGLTIIVRIILYPLTYKGMVSMQRLKDIAPKLKEIQTKYKGDMVKIQTHMMELYKKHNVNPLGGCLPLILQIPVFFAIYRVLYNAVELKDAPWLFWINDLSAMDPYFILPILMGISMYMQQQLTPTTFNDPIQEKVFKFLPLIFTIFLVTFPSGLILYWTVNNIFSIIQQIIINKIMSNKKQITKIKQ